MIRLIMLWIGVCVFAFNNYSHDPACVDGDYSSIKCSSLNVIMSPGFDSKILYGNDVFCNWQIIADDGYVLQLAINTLKIENSNFCLKDYLAVVVDYQFWPRFCGNYRSFTMTIREKMAFILFSSDSNGTAEGFTLTCEQVEADRVCGDSFVSAIGSFSASELNGGYQGYSEDSGCTWAIFSDVDALAKLRLTQLYIEEMYIASSDICEENYLEVNDQAGYVGTYCGTEPPALIESLTRALFVTLRSDRIGADQSFLAQYAIADADLKCGGVLTKDFQRITSPDRDADGAYDIGLNCKWLIVAPDPFFIGLHFDTSYVAFEIEESPEGDCTYDSLTITDYSSNAKTKLCGYSPPEPVYYSSNKLIVEFNSDIVQTGDGGFAMYIIHYESAKKSENTEEIFLKHSTSINIMSPGLGDNKHYENDMIYYWFITLEDNHALELSIHTFDLEDSVLCSKDNIWLSLAFDDLRPIELCGSIRPCALVLEPKYPYMVTIRFESDSDGTSTGFNMTCTAIEKGTFCGETFLYNMNAHVIGSFSASVDDVYLHTSTCTWTIITNSLLYIQYALKQLYIEKMHIGRNCETAYLEVHGLKNFTNTFCGWTPSIIIEAITQALFVTLHSDGLVTNQSFVAHYLVTDAGRLCGEILTLTDYFRSIIPPRFEYGYLQNVDCTWLIVTPQMAIIRILFTGPFELDQSPDGNCSYDSVTITDYNTKSLTRLCGYQRPAPMHYFSTALIVDFHSDGNDTEKRGFTLNYRLIDDKCGVPSGNVISGPFFTDNNLHDVEIYCKWEIYLYKNEMVQITFLFINIEESELCSMGYAEIHTIARFCGSYKPTDITLSSKTGVNIAYVIFYAKTTNVHGRFNLTFAYMNDYACCCTERFGSGSIYHPIDNCTWTIMSSFPNQSIQLYVARLGNNPERYTCETDYVEIRDDSGHIGNYCWKTKRELITTTSRTVYVSRHSKESVGDNRLMYVWFLRNIDKDQVCGGIRLDPEGTITLLGKKTLPGIDWDSFNLACTWLLVAPEDNVILLKFRKIVLHDSHECGNMSLTVFEWNKWVTHALYFSTLITFCGVVQPPDILSSSSVVRISFRSTLKFNTGEFIIDYKHACWRKSGLSLNCTGTDTAVDVSDDVYRDGQIRPLQLTCDPRVDSPHVASKSYHIIWSRYDAVITANKKYRMKKEIYTLFIMKPDRSDIGEYRCEVVFDQGSLEERRTSRRASVKATPQLISHTKRKILTTSDELDIHCIFSGYPQPGVTWKRDNKMVTNNSHTNHFVLEHFDDTLTMFTGRLLISKVLIEDTGVYTCEAFSEEFPGEFVSANITVWIKGSRNGGRRMANINLVHAMSIIGLLTVMFYVQH